MACLLCAPLRWMGRAGWLGEGFDPQSREDARGRIGALIADWDFAQANDWFVMDQPPLRERVEAAAALLEADPAAAFPTLLAFAEQGSIWSMILTAWCYEVGAGIAMDSERAEAWYRSAAAGGSQRAALNLAWLAWRREDFEACEAVFRDSAAGGWAPALYWVARCRMRRSRVKATFLEIRPLLERALAAGSPGAKRMLGRYLSEGWGGMAGVVRGHRLMWSFAEWVVDQERAEANAP